MEESRDLDMVRPIPAIFAAQAVHENAIKSTVRVLSLVWCGPEEIAAKSLATWPGFGAEQGLGFRVLGLLVRDKSNRAVRCQNL